MSKSNRTPYIDLPMSDMDAEFAGKQYIIEGGRTSCKHSKMRPIFVQTLNRLLFSNFAWEGITPIEARAIEWRLITTGRVGAGKVNGKVFFGMVNIGETEKPQVDFYGQPSGISLSGYNGMLFTCDSPDNFVIGYDSNAITTISPLIYPMYPNIEIWANAIDDAYQAWRIAIETNKDGLVFDAPDERSAKVLEKVIERRSENSPYIISRGGLTTPLTTIFRSSNNTVVNAYYQNLLNMWAVALDAMGIENNSAQKRERMVVEEASRNGSISKCVGWDRLKARQDFANRINELFGTNITVRNAFTSILDSSDANGNGLQDIGESNVDNSN